jgi:hypothetical protein
VAQFVKGLKSELRMGVQAQVPATMHCDQPKIEAGHQQYLPRHHEFWLFSRSRSAMPEFGLDFISHLQVQ